jgi:hypothetical protein
MVVSRARALLACVFEPPFRQRTRPANTLPRRFGVGTADPKVGGESNGIPRLGVYAQRSAVTDRS